MRGALGSTQIREPVLSKVHQDRRLLATHFCSLTASSKASPTFCTGTNLSGLLSITVFLVLGSMIPVSANQGHRATCFTPVFLATEELPNVLVMATTECLEIQ